MDAGPIECAGISNRTRYMNWLPIGSTIEAVPAGVFWNAVVVPGTLGRQLLDELGEFTGAVIEDVSAEKLYWLIPPRAGTEWNLPGIEVLSTDSWVGVPGPDATLRCRWHVSVDDVGALTEPDALRAALVAVISADSESPRSGDNAPTGERS
ncbi:hypothetical protein [Streptomyces sp. AA1529]|uniref:hypothetical protein n=1 Tax=Streptomyces sp. AA1529 TaxID=1203257 RepID=UPI0003022767|nr:hypothetical protein [Streptomyces sp. AA1529]